MPTKTSSVILLLTLILVAFTTILVNAVNANRSVIASNSIGNSGPVNELFKDKTASLIPCTLNQRFTWPIVPEVTVGGAGMGVAVGDFNGDGFQDFVSTNDAPVNSVSIRLGDGSGGFTLPLISEVLVGAGPHPIAVGDFNSDGLQDFATGNLGDNNVSLRLGDGNGGFISSPMPEIAVLEGPSSIAIADLDNDGNQDIAVANQNAASVSVRLGNGDGSFTSPSAPEIPAGNGPTKVLVGNFNGDNIPDLAVSNQWSNDVSIHIGLGGGAFIPPSDGVQVPLFPTSMALGDFNGDGNEDFVTINSVAAGMYPRLGNGNGVFTFPSVWEIPLGTSSSVAVAVGDFNNDGKQDIITGGFYNNASIWSGDGTGGFSPAAMPQVYIGANLESIAIGDFNGDGIQDFATANRAPRNDISIRLGGCFPHTIGGKVLYGNAQNGAPNPNRPVSYVMLRASGSQTTGTITDINMGIGSPYLLGVTEEGPFTVTPSKTLGVNGITSMDAAKIAQHVAGVASLIGNQLPAADVSNNGSISSFDAGEIANFVVNSSPSGRTGTWKFLPESRTYPAITSSVTGQDYIGLLIGEISGNWFDTVGRPTYNGRQGTVGVSLRPTISSTDKDLIVPVRVAEAADKNIIAFEFDLRYDPSVIQPEERAVDLMDTVSGGLTAVTNVTEPGLLRVAVYGPMPINKNGVLLNLRFEAVGRQGTSSILRWERFMFNEGEIGVSLIDGRVMLSNSLTAEKNLD